LTAKEPKQWLFEGFLSLSLKVSLKLLSQKYSQKSTFETNIELFNALISLSVSKKNFTTNSKISSLAKNSKKSM